MGMMGWTRSRIKGGEAGVPWYPPLGKTTVTFQSNGLGFTSALQTSGEFSPGQVYPRAIEGEVLGNRVPSPIQEQSPRRGNAHPIQVSQRDCSEALMVGRFSFGNASA